MKEKKQRAVITVIGKDQVGILANVSSVCARANANVEEVTQSVLSDFFCMIMIIDITDSSMQIEELQSAIADAVPSIKVHVMHENIFDAMHRI